jgi:hypothetical protein
MTLSEFVKKYDGKQVEYHSYGGAATYFQCVDIVNQYIKEVLNKTPIKGTDAKDFPTKYKKEEFDWIPNTPTGVPGVGDIIIWSGNVGGGAGHIAVVLSATANTFTSLDQNWSKKQVVTIENHRYNNVLGWLKPKGGNMSGAVMYGKPHSYDLNNHDSMKVAVDHLNDILEGRYIKKEDHQKLLNEEIERRRRAEDEASGFKKTHKEFIADLATIFGTQHNTPEILAASRQAIAYEDNYRELQEIRQKEREEWGKAIFALEGQVQTMRKELEHKDKELDDIKKKIDDLKKETPKEVEVEKPVDKLADRINRFWDRLWEIIQNNIGGK